MSFCRECGASLLDGGRFCPQCGTPAAEASPVTPSAPPRGAPGRTATEPGAPAGRPGAVGKTSATPARTPKVQTDEFQDALGPGDTPDVDTALAERYLKQPVPKGTVVCRFCKGALDLTGVYCEQCGAPVEEAAPPGLLKPRPAPLTPPATTVRIASPPQDAAVQPAPAPKPPPELPKPSTRPPVPPRAPMKPTVVVAGPATPTWGTSEPTLTLRESPVQTRPGGRLGAPAEEATPSGSIKPTPPPASPPAATVRIPQVAQGAVVQPSAAPKPPAAPPTPLTPPPAPSPASIAPTRVVAAPLAPQGAAPEATVSLRESPIQPVAPTESSVQTVPGGFDAAPLASTVVAAQPPAAPPLESAEPHPALPGPLPAPAVAADAVSVAAPTVPQPPSRKPLFAEETAALHAMARAVGGKPLPLALVALAAGLVVVAGGIAAWYFMRPAAQVPAQRVATPPPTATAPPHAETGPVPATPPEALPPVEAPPVEAAPATGRHKKVRVAKPAAIPAPAAPVLSPRAQEIASLQNQARDAYAKGNYAEPAATNSIALSKQVLALDPANGYAKTLLEDSANGGKYQVQQAILRKDFAAAHRVADALALLLPGRQDIAGLKEDIASAERADAEARRPKPAAPLVAFRAYHMHSEKAPADHGPYCLGMLSLAAGHLKFVGQTASEGQRIDTLDIPCSEVREIKKNARVASRQNGFHVRTTSTNINFVPENPITDYISVLAHACTR
jgi:hypothetical protein